MQKIANRIIICGGTAPEKVPLGKASRKRWAINSGTSRTTTFRKPMRTISMQLRAHGRKWAGCRIQRVKDRSFQKFDSRMLPGGDLYEKEKAFLEMAEPPGCDGGGLAEINIDSGHTAGWNEACYL